MAAGGLRRLAGPYPVAILAILFTLILRLTLVPWLGRQMAPIMFFMAILATACYGGWRAGLLATALGALVVDYFFIEPLYTFAIVRSGDRFQLFLFVIYGSAVSLVADAMLVTRRQSERQARLLDQAHDAIFAWEIGGPIVYWNRGAERLYGIGPQQAVGRVAYELLATAFPVTHDAVLVALMDKGEWSGELTHTTATGDRVDVESRMSLIEEPDGRRLVLESSRDVTTRKLVEQALRESHERFHRALDCIPDVVVLGITHDDTERQTRERELKRTNGLYATLSAVNRAVVSARTRGAVPGNLPDHRRALRLRDCDCGLARSQDAPAHADRQRR